MNRKYRNRLTKLLPEWTWNHAKREPITSYNPARSDQARQEDNIIPEYTLYSFNSSNFEERKIDGASACQSLAKDDSIIWLNIDGLKKDVVESICKCYNIHQLTIEDILNVGQRAKMDEAQNTIFCLLPMLYYNDDTGQVETEQVSIVMGKGFVLSFQEEASRDVFDPVRDRLRSNSSKIRQSSFGYLCYSLIDVIVDSYFGVIDKITNRIEKLEDDLLLQKERSAIARISILRREVMLIRRSISPVRDLVNGFLRSDSSLLEERQEKYYKDVLDHIMQANDYVENQRDMLMNMQDLMMSQINLRMNEVMKIFTLVATLLAPATVIGGIFGMNFDVIPLTHQKTGFWVAVALMFVVPIFMLIYFKRKGWF